MAGRQGMTGIECGDVRVFSGDESLDKVYETFMKVMKNTKTEKDEEFDENDLKDEIESDDEDDEETSLSPWDMAAKRIKEKALEKDGSKA